MPVIPPMRLMAQQSSTNIPSIFCPGHIVDINTQEF